jgi:outer membrane lipoprotein SlyB
MPTMLRYLAVAAALALAGCASRSATSDAASTAQAPREEKEYRVGSRIPVRDPATVRAN